MSIRGQAYPRQHRGYHLLRQLDVTPCADDLPYLNFSIVSPLPSADGSPLPVPASWVPFPSVGVEHLYISPSVDEAALPARFIQPLVCQGRGSPAPGVGYIGVDSQVWMRERYAPQSSTGHPPWVTTEQPEFGLPRTRLSVSDMLGTLGLTSAPPSALGGDEQPRAPVRVAVIDTDCGGWRALRGFDEASLHLAPTNQWLQFPRSQHAPAPEQPSAGHGVVMAAAVEAVAPGVRIGLFEIPSAHARYVHVTDLAAALARAVGSWEADVVLVSMAHGGWGTPPHLRSILRECARHGRGGRGAIIVCCTGRIDQNRDVHGDSPVLASDDFNAQPWVIPVAACGLEGGWYRVNGHPLGRHGPSVELCAPGELVTFPSIGAADDSSLAAALVAGTAARMVAINPGLELTELRQILRDTAVATPAENESSAQGLEAEHFNEWDRAGHNFKLGYGRLDAAGACLAAADPVCYALLATRRSFTSRAGPASLASELEAARGWDFHVRAQAAQDARVRHYLSLRGALVPLVLRAPALRDALFWLVRHLRALRQYGPTRWPDRETDHGALSDRCAHLLEVLAEARQQLPVDSRGEEISRWLHELMQHLKTASSLEVARFLAQAFAFPSSTSD